jgi:hypothetical protein
MADYVRIELDWDAAFHPLIRHSWPCFRLRRSTDEVTLIITPSAGDRVQQKVVSLSDPRAAQRDAAIQMDGESERLAAILEAMRRPGQPEVLTTMEVIAVKIVPQPDSVTQREGGEGGRDIPCSDTR